MATCDILRCACVNVCRCSARLCAAWSSPYSPSQCTCPLSWSYLLPSTATAGSSVTGRWALSRRRRWLSAASWRQAHSVFPSLPSVLYTTSMTPISAFDGGTAWKSGQARSWGVATRCWRSRDSSECRLPSRRRSTGLSTVNSSVDVHLSVTTDGRSQS